VIISIPLDFYKKTAFFFALAILASLIIVYLYGAIINRARSWIPLGFYNYQPSEFAKTAIILFMAVHYNKYKDSKKLVLILIPIFVAVAMCALTYIQPDLPKTVIFVVLTASLFFSIPIDTGVRTTLIKFAGLVIGLILVVGILTNFAFLFSGQKSRFDYHNPCAKYLSGASGYQVCNGFIAINNGGLWGVGIGNSTQKYLYLPAAHTDFIFAIMLEELGLVICLGVLLVYIIILTRIMRIAFRSRTLMGAVIAYGTAIYLFLHIAVNLVGILGLLPLTGVPLPFLSYGGGYALNLAILLALTQRVEIENKKRIQEKLIREGKPI
jgi:cell division protein FtsW